jgi:hypothetical protein
MNAHETPSGTKMIMEAERERHLRSRPRHRVHLEYGRKRTKRPVHDHWSFGLGMPRKRADLDTPSLADVLAAGITPLG